VFSNQANYQSPYSQQAEFGIERQVGPGFSVSVSYIYSHTVHLPVAIDTNLQDPGLCRQPWPTERRCRTGLEFVCTIRPPLPDHKNLCANPFNCYYSPFIAQNNQYTSAASALYQGGIVEVKKQFNKTTAIMANYTFSKAIDTTTDFNSDYGPQDT